MNYDVLKAAIAAVIKENGNQEITGEIMQQTLLAMINSLGSGATFVGVAQTSTSPGTPDPKYFYVANGAGTYPNFDNLVVGTNELAFFINPNGTWQKQSVSFTNIGVEIADNLTTESTTAALSANQGVILKTLIEDLTEYVGLTVAEINEAIAKKADPDGTYPKLVAGAAQNLVGHGSVRAEFTRRTSGGTADIGTGAAEIKKMLGNSIVWNQLTANGDFSNGITGWGMYNPSLGSIAASNNILTHSITGGETKYAYQYGISTILVSHINPSHRYLCFATVKPSVATSFTIEVGGSGVLNTEILQANTPTRIAAISQPGSYNDIILIYPFSAVNNVVAPTMSIEYSNIMVIDLTLLGLDFITTVAEFDAIFSYPYYANNSGILISNLASGIKTVGFNQWDEEVEEGGISTTNGSTTTTAGYNRSKNFIPVFAGQTYYAKIPIALVLLFYNSQQQYLGYGKVVYLNESGTFVVPADAAYMKFQNFEVNTWPTYNHDICINISWSGYRNGEYEPYWENTLPLNITTMKGKLNGEGSSVTIFADGLKAIGSVYDEYTKNQAVKRIGSRAYASGDESDSSVITDGTTTLYVLATPEVYVLDEEPVLNYKVDDFGTETELPQNTATPTTAPILYEVQYAMNAVDTLRRLPQNYISKESMENLLTAMQSAGLFSAFTMVWNATTQKYDFTITPNV